MAKEVKQTMAEPNISHTVSLSLTTEDITDIVIQTKIKELGDTIKMIEEATRTEDKLNQDIQRFP